METISKEERQLLTNLMTNSLFDFAEFENNTGEITLQKITDYAHKLNSAKILPIYAIRKSIYLVSKEFNLL